MKSFRQAARSLMLARKGRKDGYREQIKLPSQGTVLVESADERNWWENFAGAVEAKELVANEFSIRDIFEAVVPDGRSLADEWKRGGGIGLLEAAGAVASSDFSNITGQIVYSRMMEEFNQEDLKFSKLIPNVPTQFNGEKIPGIGGIGDRAETVDEGYPFPLAKVTEDWIETPQTRKRGMIVPVTKEAVFFDRTNDVLRKAGEVGSFLALNKEKRCIDCVIDENTTAHRYKWRGTVIATYGNNSGTHTWDNLEASNALVDWSDIDKMEQLFANMTDPNTGEPFAAMADTLIVTPQLANQAAFIMSSTQVALQAGGFATSGDLYQTVGGNRVGNNDLSGRYNILSSRLLRARLGTDTSWFLGNPRRAFAYMENWPLTVTTAAPNSAAEFERDIVAQFKASERGAAATIEPRYMATATA